MKNAIITVIVVANVVCGSMFVALKHSFDTKLEAAKQEFKAEIEQCDADYKKLYGMYKEEEAKVREYAKKHFALHHAMTSKKDYGTTKDGKKIIAEIDGKFITEDGLLVIQ